MDTHQTEEACRPVVSVVVPCYRQADYLPEALDSVLAQTFGQWEAIVVDDGSPDHTRDVALAYEARDPRIRYLRLDNGGPARARNQGIAQSRGEFILPLDADDRMAPTYLEEALKAFDERPQLRVVYCQAEFFGDRQGPWEGLRYEGYRQLLLGNSIFCSSVFRRRDWEAVGGYDEQMRLGFEDWEFYIRLLEGAGEQVWQIPRPLFHYRIKAVSRSTEVARHDVYARVEFYIYTKHRALYARQFDECVLTPLRKQEKLRALACRYARTWPVRLMRKWMRRQPWWADVEWLFSR